MSISSLGIARTEGGTGWVRQGEVSPVFEFAGDWNELGFRGAAQEQSGNKGPPSVVTQIEPTNISICLSLRHQEQAFLRPHIRETCERRAQQSRGVQTQNDVTA